MCVLGGGGLQEPVDRSIRLNVATKQKYMREGGLRGGTLFYSSAYGSAIGLPDLYGLQPQAVGVPLLKVCGNGVCLAG